MWQSSFKLERMFLLIPSSACLILRSSPAQLS